MTTQGPSVDWMSLAAQAQPRRKTVRLCLRGDLLADLTEAQQNGIGVGDDLRQQVEDATVSFVLAGLTRQKYRALEAAHPDADGGSGWDIEKFPEALVRACLVTPEVGVGEPLFDVLTPAQVEQLFEAAFLTCNEVDEIPLPRRV